MTRIFTAFCSVMIAMAITPIAAASPDDAAPSKDAALEKLYAAPQCKRETARPAPQSAATGKPMPLVISSCTTKIPNDWLDVMLSKRVAVSCGSLFDVDQAGVPRNIETHCDVATRKGKLTEDWRIYLETTMAVYSMREVAALRFAPSGQPGDLQKDIFLASDHTFDGPASMPQIKPFARARKPG
jgi:hypothetical protein